MASAFFYAQNLPLPREGNKDGLASQESMQRSQYDPQRSAADMKSAYDFNRTHFTSSIAQNIDVKVPLAQYHVESVVPSSRLE